MRVFLNVYLINLNKKWVLFHDTFRHYKEPICLEVTPNNLTVLKMSLVYCLSFWGKHLQSLMQGLESSWGPKSCCFRFCQAKPDWSPEPLCSAQGCRIITVTSDFFPDVAVSPYQACASFSFKKLETNKKYHCKQERDCLLSKQPENWERLLHRCGLLCESHPCVFECVHSHKGVSGTRDNPSPQASCCHRCHKGGILALLV